MDYVENQILNISVNGTNQVDANTKALVEQGSAFGRVETSAKSFGRGVTGLNQNITGFSYAMNDFFSVTGGLDQRLIAVSNNLPMMLAGLGGVGLALSAIVPIAAMVIRNWDSIETLWENTNPAKDAAQSVEELTHALSKDKEALEKLHDKATASNADLAEMARLTKAVAEQEAKLEIERAARAVKETPGKEQVERGGLFDKIVKQYGGETVTQDIRSILRERDRGSPAGVIEAQTKEYIAALKAGNSKALEWLQMLVAQGYGQKTVTGQTLLTGKTPEEQGEARIKRVQELAEHAKKADEENAQKAIEFDKEFWQGVAEQEKEAARELGKNVKELIDEVGLELKTAADTAARAGLAKAQIAKQIAPQALQGAKAIGLEGMDADEVAAAVAEQLADEVTSSRARARRVVDEKRELAGEKKEQTAEQKAARDIATHLSKVTNVDEQAAMLAAQVRQQGGAEGKFGFQRMNADQQRRYIQAEIARYLVRSGLAGAQQAQMASEPLAATAIGLTDDAMLARRAPQAQPQRHRVGPRRPNRGANGFPSVPVTGGAEPVPPALLQGAGKGADNTGKLLQVSTALLSIQNEQGRRIDRLASLLPTGLSARTAAPRGRG